MTQITVAEQLNAIKRVAKKVLKSKEASLKFMEDAGIVLEKNTRRARAKTKK